jgi:hypothetical protein
MYDRGNAPPSSLSPRKPVGERPSVVVGSRRVPEGGRSVAPYQSCLSWAVQAASLRKAIKVFRLYGVHHHDPYRVSCHNNRQRNRPAESALRPRKRRASGPLSYGGVAGR